MQIRVKKLDNSRKDISYAKEGDAGFDLYAREEVILSPGEHASIATGIALEIPEGYVGLIWDKSGLSINSTLKTLGGVVDSGFRGEVMVGMINLGSSPYIFAKGDKVAQMLIQKVEQASFQIVETLSESHRGETGFGSSGK